jgi:hypothetical protein
VAPKPYSKPLFAYSTIFLASLFDNILAFKNFAQEDGYDEIQFFDQAALHHAGVAVPFAADGSVHSGGRPQK